MAAFTVAIIIADVWFWRSNRVITHLFLGGIATTLLVVLCQRGYEMVNWAFLGLILVFLLLSKLNSITYTSDYSQEYTQSCECDTCGVPASSCSCVAPPVKTPVITPVSNLVKSCKQPISMNNYNIEDPTKSTKRWYYNKRHI